MNTHNKARNPESEWFGNEQVNPTQKTEKVIGVFDSVASKYDLMNDLMSFGVHRLWKDRFVARLRPKAGEHVLDVAGGTGDIASRILKLSKARTKVTVCDLNEHMLAEGQDRQFNKGWQGDLNWVTGNAEALPFADNSFEALTIAFGLRNVTHIDTALAEFKRVLKAGGRFFCLEFCPTQSPLVEPIYRRFSDLVIPRLGGYIANDIKSYEYLVESIRKFPVPENLKHRMEQAGFTQCQFETLTYGVVCIHTGIA